MPSDQLEPEQEEHQVNMAFLALALQRVEASDPGPLKDRILGLLTEMAEWVRRGHDLNDLESLAPLLSPEARQTLQATFGSMATRGDALAASFETTDQMLHQAQRHVTWRIHRGQ